MAHARGVNVRTARKISRPDSSLPLAKKNNNTSSASARGRSLHDIQLHLDGDLQKPTGGG